MEMLVTRMEASAEKISQPKCVKFTAERKHAKELNVVN